MANPYLPPQHPGAQGNRPINEGYGNATYVIMEAMRTTQPWTTLFSVLLFLGAGFLVLGAGLAFLTEGAARGPLAGFGAVIGAVYLLIAGVYFLMGQRLWSFRTGIVAYLVSEGDPDTLATALTRQASFWRFAGILTSVLLAIYALAFLVGIGAAVMR